MNSSAGHFAHRENEKKLFILKYLRRRERVNKTEVPQKLSHRNSEKVCICIETEIAQITPRPWKNNLCMYVISFFLQFVEIRTNSKWYASREKMKTGKSTVNDERTCDNCFIFRRFESGKLWKYVRMYNVLVNSHQGHDDATADSTAKQSKIYSVEMRGKHWMYFK